MLKEYLKSLANKFREILGTTDKINAQDFSNKVTEVYKTGKKSEYDKFWDNFQANGTRELYMYALQGYGFNSNNFYPKYDLKPLRDATRMFYNFSYGDKFSLKERLKECGVKLDTSGVTIPYLMFSSAKMFTELPIIDLSGADTSRASNTHFIFRYMPYVHTIEKIIVKEGITYDGWFLEDYKLENITFEGVIGQDISFADSPLLTRESLENIIIHLKDFAGTNTTRTLTICAESKAKLNEDGGIFMGIAT